MKKTKSKAKKHNRHNPLWLGIMAAGLLLLVLVVLQFWHNYHLQKQVTRLSNSETKTLLVNALQGLNKDALVEPSTGRVYLPEPRLMLPAYPPEIFTGIEYTYSPAAPEVSHEVLHITSKLAMDYGTSTLHNYSNIDKMFDAVPVAQACSRQIIITFKPGTKPDFENYSKIASQQLQDGRQITMFKSDICEQDSETLTAYLQQIQSY